MFLRPQQAWITNGQRRLADGALGIAAALLIVSLLLRSSARTRATSAVDTRGVMRTLLRRPACCVR